MPGERAGAGAASVEGQDTLGPELLLDTAALSQKYGGDAPAKRQAFDMVFKAPKGLSPQTLERGAKVAIEKWLYVMQRGDWRLVSKVVVGPPGIARTDNGVVLLGEHEYRARAVFEYAGRARQVRIELPLETVKQAPDHSVRAGGPHSEISRLVRAG